MSSNLWHRFFFVVLRMSPLAIRTPNEGHCVNTEKNIIFLTFGAGARHINIVFFPTHDTVQHCHSIRHEIWHPASINNTLPTCAEENMLK